MKYKNIRRTEGTERYKDESIEVETVGEKKKGCNKNMERTKE